MKTTLKLILVLTATALVAAVALAGVYSAAEPLIKWHKRVALQNAILEVVPGTETIAQPDTATYTDPADPTKVEPFLIYPCSNDAGTVVGYAVKGEGNGYQGKIGLIVGVNPDVNAVLGMKVLEHSETPGLGALIEDASFRGMFEGLTAPGQIRYLKAAQADKNNGEIDAITGATISSEAVVVIVNKALCAVRSSGLRNNGTGGS